MDRESDGGSEKIGERVRILLRGDVWYANFQHNKRQIRKSLETGSKKLARSRAARLDVELTAGVWKPAVDTVPVQKVVEDYLSVLKTEERAATTLTKYRHVLGLVVELAERRRVQGMSGLDISFLDAYRKQRKDAGKKAKTIYGECVILRQLIHFALIRNALASDPMKGVKMPKPKPTEQPCWIRREVLAILAAAPEDVRPALTLLAELGLRFGELSWLTWDDVDLIANAIRIAPKPGWKPKTGDQRSVPLRPEARAVLEALPRISKWVVPMPPSRSHPESGRQWSEKRLLVALKGVLKKLGLVGKLHTFRHAFISHALLSGIPPVVVRKWVGHVDPSILDLYSHVHDAASQEAMRKLSQADPSAPYQG